MKPFTWGPAAYRALNGIFCVYKPTGHLSKHVLENIKMNLVRDLNALPCYQHELHVMRQRQQNMYTTTTQSDEPQVPTHLNLPVPEKDYSEHRLVLGRRYLREDLWMNYIHNVPKHGSGVMLIGIGKQGKEYLELISYARYLRVYHVKCRLGFCTDNGLQGGKFMQRTTFKHVTKIKVDKVCGAVQSQHQRMMFDYAGLDPNSQEAYELASKGIIRPKDGTSPTVLYGVKCIEFNNPDFTLEIHAINETGHYLADIVHNMGLKLKSSAVITHTHRIRYGHFELEDTLLREDWRLNNIIENLRKCDRLMTPKKLLTSAVMETQRKAEAETSDSAYSSDSTYSSDSAYSSDSDSTVLDKTDELSAEDIVKSIVKQKLRT